jgi:hypothetical protein
MNTVTQALSQTLASLSESRKQQDKKLFGLQKQVLAQQQHKRELAKQIEDAQATGDELKAAQADVSTRICQSQAESRMSKTTVKETKTKIRAIKSEDTTDLQQTEAKRTKTKEFYAHFPGFEWPAPAVVDNEDQADDQVAELTAKLDSAKRQLDSLVERQTVQAAELVDSKQKHSSAKAEAVPRGYNRIIVMHHIQLSEALRWSD